MHVRARRRVRQRQPVSQCRHNRVATERLDFLWLAVVYRQVALKDSMFDRVTLRARYRWLQESLLHQHPLAKLPCTLEYQARARILLTILLQNIPLIELLGTLDVVLFQYSSLSQ